MNINILTNIIIMDSSFDLDIHNYTPNDLIKFFKLEQSYTLNDLVGKVAELTKEILSPNNTSYKTTYKNDIIKFINVKLPVSVCNQLRSCCLYDEQEDAWNKKYFPTLNGASLLLVTFSSAVRLISLNSDSIRLKELNLLLMMYKHYYNIKSTSTCHKIFA